MRLRHTPLWFFVGLAAICLAGWLSWLLSLPSPKHPEAFLTTERIDDLTSCAERLLDQSGYTQAVIGYDAALRGWRAEFDGRDDLPRGEEPIRALQRNRLRALWANRADMTVKYGYASIRTWYFYVYSKQVVAAAPAATGNYTHAEMIRSNWCFCIQQGL